MWEKTFWTAPKGSQQSCQGEAPYNRLLEPRQATTVQDLAGAQGSIPLRFHSNGRDVKPLGGAMWKR